MPPRQTTCLTLSSRALPLPSTHARFFFCRACGPHFYFFFSQRCQEGGARTPYSIHRPRCPIAKQVMLHPDLRPTQMPNSRRRQKCVCGTYLIVLARKATRAGTRNRRAGQPREAVANQYMRLKESAIHRSVIGQAPSHRPSPGGRLGSQLQQVGGPLEGVMYACNAHVFLGYCCSRH